MIDSPDSTSSDPDDEWREMVKRLLKVELKRQDLTYEDLAERLRKVGLKESATSVRNKINRGTFPATFLFQVFHVMGVTLVPYAADMHGGAPFEPERLQGIEFRFLPRRR